jgi:hypothetical protein
MKKIIILGLIFMSVLIVHPQNTSAATTSVSNATASVLSTLQSRIEKLMAEVKMLQEQVARMSPTSVSSTPARPVQIGTQCTELSRTLMYQSRDNEGTKEVSKLQDFLRAKGYLNSESTGFFGPLTRDAMMKLQKDSGETETGALDQHMRESIKSMSCGGTSTSGGVQPTGIMCTMEARLCDDGSVMPRNMLTCEWLPNQCGSPKGIRIGEPSPTGIMCTQNMRYCSDGSVMPRNMLTCEWLVKECPLGSTEDLQPTVRY